MAKKQNIPDSIEKQFNKALFKLGEPVFFTWLGSKKYGYVNKHKQANWGTQYSVLSMGTTYPCGIQIKEYKTSYHTGCIIFDETNRLGNDELKKRIDSGPSPYTTSEVFRDTSRTTNEIASNNSNKRKSSNKSNTKTKSNSTGSNGVENDVQPSNNGVQQRDSKKRKNTELDSAIQKQRNFLNGFVKKD